MKTKIFFFFLIFTTLISQTFAQSLTPTEKQIATYLAQQQDEQLNLLEKLVNINSGTENLAGVMKVGEILRAQFNELGFTTQWVKLPPTMKRAATLVAEHRGKNAAGKRLLLIGHLDTVFAKNSPFQTFTRHGQTATGPGVIDIKGGDVVMLYALKALQAAKVLAQMNIMVVLTGDEEDAGKPTTISRQALFDAAQRSDIALDFESANSLDTASIARRGISSWTIQTTGKQMHSSKIFQNNIGYGAIYELTRILDTMQQQLSQEKYLTINPGIILGGTSVNYLQAQACGEAFGKKNVIARIAMANGDLRYLTAEQKLSAEKNIAEIVSKHLPGTEANIQFVDGIPAMPPTKANEELLEKYSQASLDLGYGAIKALDPGARGAGDISYIAEKMTANLVGLGAMGSGDHSTEETVELNSLVIQAQRAAVLMYRLMQR